MNSVLLQQEHELFRKSLRALFERHVIPKLDTWESEGTLPYRELFPLLGAHGYLGIAEPEEYGGLGLDYRYTAVWAQELGRIPAGALPMSLSVQTDIVLPALRDAGDEVKDRYLRAAIAGDSVAAFAVTEAAGGSDPRNIATTAVASPDGYVLNGEKAWITNGTVADFYVAACRTGNSGSLSDLSLFVVPAGSPGVTRRAVRGKLGNRACDHGMVAFQDVRVPPDHLIGSPGDGYELMTRTFARERRFLATVAAAQARRILTGATAWARAHAVLDTQLIDHQAVRFALTDLFTELDLVEAYIDRWSTGAGPEDVPLKAASVMKLRAGRLVRAAADTALQLHGARAYMSDTGPARDARDARAASLAGGADQALLHLLGGHLGSDE